MKTPSLNHAYRLIWSHVSNAWVAVSEATKGHGKSRSGKRLLKRSGAALVASALLLSPTLTFADQTGGAVVSGAGSITQTTNLTTINQASQTLGLTWDTFNINVGQTVNFIQPNAAALAVNRIFDTNGSRIMGNLNANGQVWLINPNGVFFGAGSQVNVGSILASTLNPLSNTGDMDQVFGNGGTGSVINQGNITAANGGYVAMLGNKVINEGVITAQMGTVALGAGSEVSLQFNGNKLLGLTVNESTLNNLAANNQLVKADGGLVFMSAGAKDSILASTVNNTGVIEAQTVQNQDGKIILMGGMASGTTNVAGTLNASAAQGNGGFIETSAASVRIEAGAKITTKAENGETGTWLIDPTDFTVNAGAGGRKRSSIGADTLATSLANSDITIRTTKGSGKGNINVDAAVSWGSANALTLKSRRGAGGININQDITFTNGGLNLNATGTITATGAVNGKAFNLQSGTWNQVGPTLAAFNVTDFRISGGTFIRALGGDGAVAAPYQLTDVYGLQGVGSAGMLGKSYTLVNNIDASGTTTWNGIAGFNSLGNHVTSFTGTFDGLGHTVDSLFIYRPGSNFIGLFGYNNGGTIKNVGITNVSITGKNYTGGLVGHANSGNITNSYAAGKVSGNNYHVGGLVGRANNSDITNSYAIGDVTGGINNVGGLVGHANGGNITNSYATGKVTGNRNSGGLVGGAFSNNITNSYSTGKVTGTSNVGGLVGGAYNSDITNSYATGAVDGNDNYVGGLVGGAYNGSDITNSYATGDVTGGINNVGGLVGGADNNSDITNSYYTDTTGQAGTGTATTIQNLAAALPTGFAIADWGNGGNQTTPYLLSHGIFDTAGPVYLGTDALASTPYQALINVIQLQAVNKALSGNYVLGNNIDASATSGWNSSAGFKPLGGDGSGQEFTGVFDGLNHTITKLTINRTGDDIGLFGGARGAMIKNVGLIDASITGGKYTGGLGGTVYSSTIHHSYVKDSTIKTNTRQPTTPHFNAVAGGLVGYSESNTISDSYSEDTTVLAAGPYSRAGGLVGISNSSAISNSHASGSVTASFTTTYSGIAVTSSAGGLVGMAENSSTITNSYATGSATAEADAVHYAYTNAGGLVGSNIDTNISQSYATTGAVQAITKATYNIGGYTKAGGLVGYNNNSQISDTYATGDVTTLTNLTTANVSTGGLIGDNLSSAINKSYATGKVTVSGDGMAKGTGGLVGQSNDGSISDSYAIGSVNGHYRVGGLVGYNLVTSISNSYSESVVTGSIVGSSRVGGLVGDNGFDSSNGGDIDKSYATGIVNGGANVGGLVGISKKGAITDSYATGPVTGTNISVGGLVGSITSGNIKNSYALGDVVGALNNTGGLVGNNYDSNIENSYASGDVSGSDSVGGLAGRKYLGTFSNTYATGKVTGTSNLGGLVGSGSTGITNSYYADTTGQAGTGTATTIQNLAAALPTGFAITDWGNGGNQTTPYLLSHGIFDTAGPVYLGTDATASTPYQALINVNQLQAVNKALSGNYVLGNNIGASATSGWNSSAGFNPLGNDTTNFTGTFDGLGHTVDSLFVHRPSSDYIGLFGYNNGGTIKNVGITNVSITGGNYVGGLAGYTHDAEISNSYATGDVTGTSNYVGGLVGRADGGDITDSYAKGLVTGTNNVGGLVGHTHVAEITDSYATGKVTGEDSVGGLIGYQYLGQLSNSYASGKVTGNTKTGGLIGNRTGTVSDSFWNTTTSTQANGVGSGNSNGITGKTTTQMQQETTFTNWDISSVGGEGKTWRIYEGQTAPLLRSFMTQLDLTGSNKTTDYDGATQSIAAGTDLDEGQGTDWPIGFPVGFPEDYVPLLIQVSATAEQSIVLPDGTDPNLVQGETSGKNAGTYNGLYSSQQGYDIVGGVLTIEKKALTITGMAASNKTYDGNDAAALTGGTLATGITGEALTFTGQTGAFTDKNVANGIAVTVTGTTLGNGTGGLASNYSLTQPTVVAANIAAKALTITGMAASNKTYDGNDAAALTGGTLATGITGEALTFTGQTGAFTDKNVANGIAVTVTGTTLGNGTGGLASNYSLTQPTVVAANIAAKALTITGMAASNKTYDGNDAAALTGGTLATSIAGETLTFTNQTGTFTSKDVANGIAVTVTSTTLGNGTGSLASNYSLTQPTGLTANIDKATLTYVATPNTMTAGTTPNLTGNVTGFVGHDDLSVTAGGLLWNTAGVTTQPGTYDITGSGLAAHNYGFVQAPINATALTVQAGSPSSELRTTAISLLPSGTAAPAQTQVTMIDVNNPLTASDGEEGEGGGFINDPQSKTTGIDVVYSNCDSGVDCDKDATP